MAVNNAVNGSHVGKAALWYALRPAAVEHVSGGNLWPSALAFLPLRCCWCWVTGVPVRPAVATPLGTAFTYQGQLEQSGVPANGSCDMLFSLFDAASGGTQIGSPQPANPVSLTNGLFTVPLDFGSGVFTGADRFLEIQVRCPAGSGVYVTLSPRQKLTAAPYAL